MHKQSVLDKAFRQILIVFVLLIYPVATFIMWLAEKKTGDKI